MDETKLPTTATLRPHHGLCALFFEGKGYSPAFIENMAAFMADPNRPFSITSGCDTLCMACPNNVHGKCIHEGKVTLFDQRTLNLIGGDLETDQPIQLNALCQRVYDAILQPWLLAEICGECEWAALCQDKWRRGDFNRQLLQSDLAGSPPFRRLPT